MQVKKKAAKKTYKSSAKKKTVPSLKKMSVEELLAVMAENHAKTEASIDRLSAVQAKTEASLLELHAEVRETSAEVRETSAKVRETSESVRQLNDTLGGMGGHLGEVIEFIVVPKIRPAVNALGDHSFKEITARKIVETVITIEREN